MIVDTAELVQVDPWWIKKGCGQLLHITNHYNSIILHKLGVSDLDINISWNLFGNTGGLSKYGRAFIVQAFIVYMFRRPPEVWSLVSDNASISGTGKAV